MANQTPPFQFPGGEVAWERFVELFADPEARAQALEFARLMVERDRALEDAMGSVETAVFSGYGAVTVTPAGDPPEWEVQRGGEITTATFHLATAGSSSSVFTYYLNGVSMGTATLLATETEVEVDLGSYVARRRDKIQGRITTAGTGAKGPSAFVPMKG